jgi:hypothetical protein
MFHKFLLKLLNVFFALFYFQPQIFYLRFKIYVLRRKNRKLRLEQRDLLRLYFGNRKSIPKVKE